MKKNREYIYTKDNNKMFRFIHIVKIELSNLRTNEILTIKMITFDARNTFNMYSQKYY